MSLTVFDFFEIHHNKMAFILGAGPSLHSINTKVLEPYVTFAVNSSIMKMPQANYFVTDDSAANDWNWYRSTAASSSAIKFLFKPKLIDKASHFRQKEIAWFDHVPAHSPDFDPNCVEGYEFEDTGEIVAARTSAGTAVHLAWLMGCNPIVLLGCDACHSQGKRYFWQFPGESKAFRPDDPRPPWLTADKGVINGRAVDQHCLDFCDYWQRIADKNKNSTNIIYSSGTGIVDAFPRMNMQEVIKRYGERKRTICKST